MFLRTLPIFFACLLAACTHPVETPSQKNYSISVKDLRGKTVQLEKPAQRVVCLFNGSFDALYMLGAEERIVGIPANIYSDPEYYDAYAKIDERIKNKRIAAPGSWQASNIETIAALHPDLVIISAGQTDAIEILESIGITVYAVASETYEQIYRETLDIGKLMGTAARAAEIVDYSKREFAKIQQYTKNIRPKKRVYYAWSGGRILSTSGTGSMINSFIELAGAVNVCRSPIDQPNVNAETLLHWNPDLVVLWGSKPVDVYGMTELASLKAVRNRMVKSMEPAFFYNTHTLKILYASVTLSHWCYGSYNDRELEKDKRDIILHLYGEKGLKLLP